MSSSSHQADAQIDYKDINNSSKDVTAPLSTRQDVTSQDHRDASGEFNLVYQAGCLEELATINITQQDVTSASNTPDTSFTNLDVCLQEVPSASTNDKISVSVSPDTTPDVNLSTNVIATSATNSTDTSLQDITNQPTI